MSAGAEFRAGVRALGERRPLADLTAVLLLLVIPIVGFWPTFAEPDYLVAAGGGALAGIAIAAVGRMRRLGILPLAGLTVLAYLLLGGALALPHTAVAGVVPTLETLRQLIVGVVTSWKQLLTTVAPVAASDGHLLVPFLLTLVAAVLTASLALRLRTAAWALLPAGALLCAQIALGTSEPAAPLVQGALFAVVAAGWLALRQAWGSPQDVVSLAADSSVSHAGAVRRLVAGGAVVAVAVGLGVVTTAVAPAPTNRYVLRDVVIPPFDIREYPSPLQSFRAYVRDYPDAALFTVQGLPDDARVRLATMDAYNGMVYNVSDAGAGSSSAFAPVRGNMSVGAEGTPATLRFEIDDLPGVWLPEAGAATGIVFDGPRADDLRRSAHYNEATRTGVVTARLAAGDAYTMTTVLPRAYSDEQLAAVPFAPVRMPKQTGVPTELSEIASDATVDADTPIAQARALQTFLSQQGFFSHGLEGEVLSRAGHGAERITTFFGGDQLVGDDEQYAAAMALLAGQLGIPARVVMGFYPDEADAGAPTFEATGDTLHAWVEIAFDGVGWVSFDPTPPEDQIPNDQTPKPRAEPKPQVLQPPPPLQDPVDLPPTIPDEREPDEDAPVDLGILGIVLAVAGGLLGVAALLLAPFLMVGALKLRRRRRRREAERAADRISGGWNELVDHATDYGTALRPGSTRGEDAGILTTALSEPRVATLAERADADVFGPADPTPDDIEEFWRQVDEIVTGMGADRSLAGRLRARVNVRSLLAGTPLGRRLPPPRPPRTPGSPSVPRGSRAARTPPTPPPNEESPR